jgi:hypothetical protein
MGDRERVAALVERIVAEAGLADDRARDELRRELTSHFEEAGAATAAGDPAEALRAALARFGDPGAVGAHLRRAHGRTFVLWYAVKIAVAVGISLAVALAVQFLASVRIVSGESVDLRLASGYLRGLGFLAAVVLLVAAAWELDVEPLCVRLERRPLRLAAALGLAFAGVLAVHEVARHVIPPAFALVGAATVVVVWACTLAVLARVDLAFHDLVRARR